MTDRHYDTNWGPRCFDGLNRVWRFLAPEQHKTGAYIPVEIIEHAVDSHERCSLYARMGGWSRGRYYHEGDRIQGNHTNDVGPLVPALPPDEVARINAPAVKELRKRLHKAGFRQYTAEGEKVA